MTRSPESLAVIHVFSVEHPLTIPEFCMLATVVRDWLVNRSDDRTVFTVLKKTSLPCKRALLQGPPPFRGRSRRWPRGCQMPWLQISSARLWLRRKCWLRGCCASESACQSMSLDWSSTKGPSSAASSGCSMQVWGQRSITMLPTSLPG